VGQNLVRPSIIQVTDGTPIQEYNQIPKMAKAYGRKGVRSIGCLDFYAASNLSPFTFLNSNLKRHHPLRLFRDRVVKISFLYIYHPVILQSPAETMCA
jgi:hypothetical protein